MMRGCRLGLTLCVLALATSEVAAEARPRNGFQQLLHDEGGLALASGQLLRAEFLFARLLELDPDDPVALREGGRCAQALGRHDWAEHWLARAERLQGGRPDPELHYLRGEALSALGRPREARRQRALAERELGLEPPGQMVDLWTARLLAERGELAAAEAIYRRWLPQDTRTALWAELVMYIVEAHTMTRDWPCAERLLGEVTRRQPALLRARQLLAWVLEARGKLDAELGVRAALVDQAAAPGDGEQVMGYARALERARDEPAAFENYRRAGALGRPEAADQVARLRYRLAPELVGGVTMREDPSGSARGVNLGVTFVLGARERLLVTASHEIAGANPLSTGTTGEVAVTTVGLGGVMTSRSGITAALGVSMHQRGLAQRRAPGATLSLRTPEARRLQVAVGGEVGMPWRESASTIREGGMFNALHAEIYVSPLPDRLIVSLGGLARQFSLQDADAEPVQLFAAAGLDLVLGGRPDRTLRGESFDDTLQWSAAFANAAVLSYRHYELTSEDPFGARMVMVEQSRSDELSGLLRHVFGRPGGLGGELRAGLGYASLREVRLGRIGGGLVLAPSARTRFTAAYDFARESGTGLTGQRHSGWVTLHVDL